MAASLYPYQELGVGFLGLRQGFAGLFMEMGTGKTRTALEYLRRSGAKRILVVAPLSVLGVWVREIVAIGFPLPHLNLGTGTMEARAKTLKGFGDGVVLVNYEAYWRQPFRRAIERWMPDSVVLDEAHRIKNRTTRQARFAHTLAALPVIRRRLALTGTPVTNGLEDLYSIYRFIDPRVFGTVWSTFEWEYIIKGGFGGYQIVGYRNQEKANRLVRETAYQISKSEALDLPERTDVVVPVTLDARTRTRYDRFRRDAIAEVEGVDEDGKPKTGIALARIVLSSILRLQQIANGFVAVEDGSIVDLSDEKVRIAKDLTTDALESGQQVVIFCRFIHDVLRLAAQIPEAQTIYGAIKPVDRDRRIEALHRGLTRVLICQVQVASLGIDLTAASVGIFFSTGFSLADFLQSRDRLHRHGQTKKVTYYHLLAERTVDEQVYRALDNKQNIASQVVNLDYARRMLGAGNAALQREAIDDALAMFSGID